MIITVTMNPAVDKTVEIDHFEYGGLNRLKNVISDGGGKGINVSKTISALGGSTVATGFVGGGSGQLILDTLKDYGIQADFVKVSGATRTNMKVMDNTGTVTELNEPGPVISEAELQELVDKIAGYAKEGNFFVLAGSIPNGVPKDIYKTLTELIHEKGGKVFLDADGELFVKALGAAPNYIKPNRVELEEYYKVDYRLSMEELVVYGRKMLANGMDLVAISLGQMGAMFLTENEAIRCPGLSIEAHSTVGAGDAMVAALTYGLDAGLDLEACIRLAIATSAGAVTTKGTKPPTRELVDELQKQVEIIHL